MKKYILLALLCCMMHARAQDVANISYVQNKKIASEKTESDVASAGVVGEVLRPQDVRDDEQDAPAIYLNFENASLGSVVQYLGEQKKINLIPHKELDDIKVSLTTRTPLTLERAWNVLLTLLEMNTFSMIKVGNIYRIVHSKDNGLEPLPVYSSETGTAPEELPDSDMVVRYFYFFKNIKAEMAQGILSSMIEDPRSRIIRDLNCCILQDQCFNIKAAMKIIKELDLGGVREQIKIIPLKYADADTINTLFQDILQIDQNEKNIRFAGPTVSKERTYFSSNTKIYPDMTKNRLILLGTEKNLNKITEFIYKHLDVPLGMAESRLHIYELRYASAETLTPILNGILKPPSGADKSPIVSGYKFFEDVFIAPDSGTNNDRGSGNRLIIASNKDDWNRLKRFIDKLDKPQPQIALEVMFVNVLADKTRELGAQTWGFKGKNPGMGIERFETYHVSGTSEKSGDSSSGLNANYMQVIKKMGGAGSPSYMTLGRPATETSEENIWAFIRARFNIENQNVISQPYVVTNNNELCEIDINRRRLVPGPLETVNKSTETIQKKVHVEANTTVKITPRINLEGIVDLDVDISIDEFKEVQSADQPETTKRSIVTRASLATGEVLVLGGMTEGKDQENTYKTPILGDIPLIGNLFKTKTKTHQDVNLYVFIRPSIIKPRFEGGSDEYSQLKIDYAKYQMMKNDSFAYEKDPIQRWFFKPSNQSIKNALADRANGIYRPIDDFATGKHTPKAVRMRDDPYFKESASIKERQEKRSVARSKKARRSEPRVATIDL